MYEYDLCLSKLLHAWEDAAKVIREYDSDPPDELRLSGTACLDCFEKDYTGIRLTDVDVDKISKRWHKLGILRDLYLDEAVSRDFEQYKAQFVSVKGPGYSIIEESPELAIESNSNHKYAPDFKARFHQSLCLHSIALAARSHAVHSRDQPLSHDKPRNLIGERLCNIACNLWVKHDVVLNGRPVQLGEHAQYDCIEIIDFLYYFLLEKVVPFSASDSWTTGAADRYPYDDAEDSLESWSTLLYHCRFALQPLDIVDLVKHKTWRAESNYPADKTRYMCERGLFDLGGDGNADYHTGFTRYYAIQEIRQCLCSGGDFSDYHKSCLWDDLRIKLGSPFRPGFREKLDLEISRVELVETP